MENGKRQYAVFGLGNFGTSLALTLQKSGCDVIAVDNEMARVDAIKDSVSYAIRANFEDENLIRSIEVKNLDGVIIAAGDNMEATIMATLLAKEEGVPFVLTKAKDSLQEAVLRKVGADHVIRSEQEMGRQVAQELVSSRYSDGFTLSSECEILEKPVPKSWVGKSLRELDVRNRLGVTVSGIRESGVVNMNPDPTQPLKRGIIVILAGKEEQLKKII